MAEQSNRQLVTRKREELSNKKMGKNSVVIPISLDSGSSARRSLVESNDNGNNEGRNCSESPNSARTRQHKIPHYLRASTGSCHDICKYGGRHAFEEKVIKPIPKRSAKPSLNDLKSVKVIVLSEQKKRKVVKHKPSIDSEKCALLVKPSPDAKSFLSKVETSFDAKTHSCCLDASSSGKTCSPNLSTKKSDSSKTQEKLRVREGNCSDNKHLSSTSDNSDGKGRRSGDVQTSSNMRASIVSAKKSSAAPLFLNGSLRKASKIGKMKLLSPGKDQNRIYNVENGTSNSKVLEEILPGTENNPSESSTSPISLSLANPPPLFNEGDDGGIKYIGDETDVISSQLTLPVEIGNVKSVVENHMPLEMGTCTNTTESIPDYYTNPNPIFHDEEIKHSDNGADDFFIDKNISMDNDKVHHVKENHYTALRMVTEKNFKSTANGDVIPALPSPSSSNSSPLLSDEEDGEDIKNIMRQADELVSRDSETMKIIKRRSLKGDHNNNLSKTRMVGSGYKHCRPTKLKFRRGKVVDLHQESNIPKRLIFRRIRVSGYKPDGSVFDNKKLVENDSSQPMRESHKVLCNKTLRKSRVVVSDDKSRSPVRLFKRERRASLQFEDNNPWRIILRRARTIGVGDGKSEFKRDSKTGGGQNDVVGTNLSSRKVNLKHRNLQRKKDGKCLLNNVIEETATKLVESRKSKVKALVGAFETVISLQECKSSLCTAS